MSTTNKAITAEITGFVLDRLFNDCQTTLQEKPVKTYRLR
jgi:hypothetical protein